MMRVDGHRRDCPAHLPPRRPPRSAACQVAGKTGTLSDKDPYRDYTWFVGFAPADNPEVAVATVIANDRRWRVHAPAVAREALEAYFGSQLARSGGGAPARARTTRVSAR